MLTLAPLELLAVREALREEPSNYGVGVLHQPSERIALRPFDDIRFRGGHRELVDELGWRTDDCLGFLVAQQAGKCVLVNLAHLNAPIALICPRRYFVTWC